MDVLKDRLCTIAELRLMDIEVGEYLTELISEYGQNRVQLAITELGLAGILELDGKGERI